MLWIRIPSTAEIKLISAVHSISGFTQPIRYNENRLSMGGVLHITLRIKTWVSVRWLAVVSDCIGAGVENNTWPTTQAVHTQASHILTALHHIRDYLGYVRHVRHAARSNKNYLWLLGLEYAMFLLHEKWNNCPYYPYRTCGLNTINRRRIHARAWPLPWVSRAGYVIKFIHSFIISIYNIYIYIYIYQFWSRQEWSLEQII